MVLPVPAAAQLDGAKSAKSRPAITGPAPSGEKGEAEGKTAPEGGGAGADAVLPGDGRVGGEEVRRHLLAAGYRAEMDEAADGTPLIRTGIGGSKVTVYFYNCNEANRCYAIQFVSGFNKKDGSTFEAMNAWNRKWRFGRAYLDDEKDPYIEYDIEILPPGFTREAFDIAMNRYERLLASFKQHIEW